MLLIVSNSHDATADYLESVLKQQEVPVRRFDTDISIQHSALMYDGTAPILRLGQTWCQPDDFNNVWFRRPEVLKHPQFTESPEDKFILNEWSEALEGFFAYIEQPKWMNHPSLNVAASHKVEQLTRAKTHGLKVPDTLITQDSDQLREFYKKHAERIVVKPIASGCVKRESSDCDSLIYTNAVLRNHLEDLDDLPGCPTLFQEKIDKLCDVRITIVDRDIHATELLARDADGIQRCDIRRNGMEDVTYRAVTLPEDVDTKLRSLTAYYRLRFAAIDMAVSKDGDWYFLEVNPNGQWAWLDLAGGMNIAHSFIKAFSNG